MIYLCDAFFVPLGALLQQTVQCFSYSSTVGLVLVDSWVEVAIFLFSFGLIMPY